MASRIALSLILFAAALLPACEDKKKPTPDAAELGDGGMCAGATGYLAACTANDECMSCVCHSFGHSMICTKACTGDMDCPAPSGGCTGGFCRP